MLSIWYNLHSSRNVYTKNKSSELKNIHPKGHLLYTDFTAVLCPSPHTPHPGCPRRTDTSRASGAVRWALARGGARVPSPHAAARGQSALSQTPQLLAEQRWRRKSSREQDTKSLLPAGEADKRHVSCPALLLVQAAALRRWPSVAMAPCLLQSWGSYGLFSQEEGTARLPPG